MKLEKKKNAFRNIVFGVLFKFITIIAPFIIRTIMIHSLGNNYVGLNSLFTSILQFLSLAELGVGSALVFSMYKPIAEDDHDMICALLNLYRKVYRYIGTIILVVGVVLTPFLKYLVKGGADSLPADVDLYVLYYIYLFNTVISYFMFAYKQSLLVAHQRNDAISKRSIIVQTSMYVLQIMVLVFLKNYYAYIILLPIATLVTNIANSMIVDKLFPQYKCVGEVPAAQRKEITKKVTALFGTKANSIVMHAADNIVISAFCGIVLVGQYGNYYYIMNSIIGIMTIIYQSITAGIGNSIETETMEKVHRNFKQITFLNTWLTMFCTVALLCIYQPFMVLWVKEKNMLGMDMVILLVCYFYIYQIRRVILTYKDAFGLWWEDRFRPYLSMIVNLVLNIILVQIIGLPGVLISTIVSMIVSVPWENYTVFKYLFKMSSKQFYLSAFWQTLICVVIAAVTYFICSLFPTGVVGLLIRMVICVIVPNALFLLINCKNKDLKSSMEIILKKTRKFSHH